MNYGKEAGEGKWMSNKISEKRKEKAKTKENNIKKKRDRKNK